jgi:hypothetical protein
MAFPHKSAREARTDQHRPGLSTVGIEAAEGLFTAGLALQDAAAVAVDPLVHGRIEEAVSALDDVIRIVRDAAFGTEHDQRGGGFPGQLTVAGRQHDGLVRYWLGEGESALDVAITALSRAGELEHDWSNKFGSDASVLRSKLALLHEAVSGH